MKKYVKAEAVIVKFGKADVLSSSKLTLAGIDSDEQSGLE